MQDLCSREGEGGNGVGRSVVYGDSARFRVLKAGAREGDVGDVANVFVRHSRVEYVVFRPFDYFPWSFQIEEGHSGTVHEAVAGCPYAVIYKHPTF